VDADLDTLATALYVRADDLLKRFPEQVPRRPAVGIAPRICEAEVGTLAVLQAESGAGLDAQRHTIRAEATRRGWRLLMLEWTQDCQVSRCTTGPRSRPPLPNGFRGADVPVVAKLDQLSRSVADFCSSSGSRPKARLGVGRARPRRRHNHPGGGAGSQRHGGCVAMGAQSDRGGDLVRGFLLSGPLASA
jgi:hypothetical protein